MSYRIRLCPPQQNAVCRTLYSLSAAVIATVVGLTVTPVSVAAEDWFLEGFADLRYTYRGAAAADDHDGDQYVSLSFGEAQTRWLTGYVSGRMSQHLGGIEEPDPFPSTPHTYGRFFGRLSSAYLDLRPEWHLLDTARLGRQWLAEVPEIVRLDGVWVKSGKLEPYAGSRVLLFGGIPDHLDEPSAGGDRVFGGGVELNPLETTRLSAVYARIRDVYEVPYAKSSSGETFRENLISCELRQRLFEDQIQFFGGYTNLNGDSRDLRLRVRYDSPSGATGAYVTYRALFSTQELLSTELDPYYSALRSYHPYQELGLGLNQDITAWLLGEVGFFIRRLGSESDVGPFNHDFERYFARATVLEWPLEGSTLTIVGNGYETGSDRLWEVEGSFLQRIGERLRLEAGTGHALFKENRYSFEEHSNVRTLYARGWYDICEALAVRARYTVEDDDDDTTPVVEVGLRVRF